MGKIFDFDLTVLTRLPSIWAVLLHLCLATLISLHVVLRKRDPRSAVAWLGVVWLSPFAGAFIYYVLGINRITRKATRLRPKVAHSPLTESQQASHKRINQKPFVDRMVAYVDRVVSRPLVGLNHVEVIGGGETVYPIMIKAIHEAQASITLSSYIFDRGKIARELIAALRQAIDRNVEVRVLVDAVGAHYTLPTVNGLFHSAGIKLRFFLPVFMPWQFGATNLRNHRKLLIIDGKKAFTGGLNIRDRHDRRLVSAENYVEDLHFLITGAVVQQLQEVFVDDWFFTTGERLLGYPWYQHKLEASGPSFCRTVADGPDEDFEKIKWVMLGAISKASERIWIVNPYFVPDSDLIASLKIAGLSGLDVRIIVPKSNNIPLVHWASLALLPGLIESGVRVYFSQPPFDHSKIMIVDDEWSFIGSTNWDARSLRLNFELNVEVYDSKVNGSLADIFLSKQARAQRIDGEWIANRSLFDQLRDNSARLLSPYL